MVEQSEREDLGRQGRVRPACEQEEPRLYLFDQAEFDKWGVEGVLERQVAGWSSRGIGADKDIDVASKRGRRCPRGSRVARDLKQPQDELVPTERGGVP